MKKPVIAITTNFSSVEINQNPDSAYAAAVAGAGGIPVLLPRDIPKNLLISLRDTYNGLILSGGGDVDICHFNGEPNPAIGIPSPQRDSLELALVKLALESNWPIFGICRGIQILNIALGGTLYTDIPSQYKKELNHNTPTSQGRQFLAHKVLIEKGCSLAKIMAGTSVEVNSFHHQAIKKVATGLTVTACATDGLIEAVALPERTQPFFGVQWHPENLQNLNPHKALFVEFVRSCA